MTVADASTKADREEPASHALLVRACMEDREALARAAETLGLSIEWCDAVAPLRGADIAVAEAPRLKEPGAPGRPAPHEPGPVVLAVLVDGPQPSLAKLANYVSGPDEASLTLHLELAMAERADRTLWVNALLAFRFSSEAIEIADPQARLLDVNAAWEAATGYRREEAVGHIISDLVRSDAHPPELFEQIWHQVAVEGRSWSGELVSRRADGEPFHNLLKVLPPLRIQERIVGLVASRIPLVTAGDVDDGAEPDHGDRVQEIVSAQLYSRLVSAANDGIFVLDATLLTFIDANPAGLRIVRRTLDELRHLSLPALVSEEARPELDRSLAHLRTHGAAEIDRLPLLREGQPPLMTSLRISSFVIRGRHVYAAVIRDVTSLLERERELETLTLQLATEQARSSRSAQLATIGELAAGVAHEVNNPASYVLLNVEHLRELLDEPLANMDLEDAKQLLDESIDGLQRIGAITRELLPFARDTNDDDEPLDVADEVRRALRLVENEVRHRAQLETDLRAVPSVLGRPGRISQVVTNLILNAVHSLPEANDAEHRIRVRVLHQEAEIRIDVEDNGEGIPEELRQRIFEPFFTTKERFGGTGLGLALSQEIVSEMGGRLTVQSALGEGSTFTVRLPPVMAELGAGSRPAPSASPVVMDGAIRLLLVDDEPKLLRAQARLLRKSFQVETALGGQEALDKLDTGGAFDAILCDLMMPGVDGRAVFEAIARRHPALQDRVVFQTGGVFHERVSGFLKDLDNPVLSKPAPIQQVIDTLRSVAGER